MSFARWRVPGRPLTIRAGLEILLQAAAIPIEIRTDPERLRPSDLPFLVGDNSKLCQATSWEAEFSLEETLRALLDDARADTLRIAAKGSTMSERKDGT